jgi:transcriptional regulator with XRE-family HTH domain
MTLNMQAGRIPVWTLADRLQKARETSGLDQFELAERMGISRRSVSNYERGVTRPRVIVLNAWAMATGVDRHWLLDEDVPGGAPGETVPPVGLEPTTHWLALAAA